MLTIPKALQVLLGSSPDTTGETSVGGDTGMSNTEQVATVALEDQVLRDHGRRSNPRTGQRDTWYPLKTLVGDAGTENVPPWHRASQWPSVATERTEVHGMSRCGTRTLLTTCKGTMMQVPGQRSIQLDSQQVRPASRRLNDPFMEGAPHWLLFAPCSEDHPIASAQSMPANSPRSAALADLTCRWPHRPLLSVLGREDTTGLVPPADTTAAESDHRSTITADDLDSELGCRDISGILQSSRDLFTSTAAFELGQCAFPDPWIRQREHLGEHQRPVDERPGIRLVLPRSGRPERCDALPGHPHGINPSSCTSAGSVDHRHGPLQGRQPCGKA